MIDSYKLENRLSEYKTKTDTEIGFQTLFSGSSMNLTQEKIEFLIGKIPLDLKQSKKLLFNDIKSYILAITKKKSLLYLISYKNGRTIACFT